jgi:mRNA interferase MazF
MAAILRGEVRWAQLDPTVGNQQSGHRPVVILSNDVFNQRSQEETLPKATSFMYT